VRSPSVAPLQLAANDVWLRQLFGTRFRFRRGFVDFVYGHEVAF